MEKTFSNLTSGLGNSFAKDNTPVKGQREAVKYFFKFVKEGNLPKVKHALTSLDFDVTSAKGGHLGVSPLSHALFEGQPAIAKYFLSLPNIDVNMAGDFGITPIVSAVMACDIENIKNLIEKGAKVNHQMNLGHTVLHIFAQKKEGNKDLETLKTLIRSGANVNIQDDEGDTPLHLYALDKSKLPLLKVLINANANLDLRNNVGRTSLDMAIKKGNEEIVRELKRAGAKESSIEDRAKTKAAENLFSYIKKGNVEKIKLALTLEEFDVNKVRGGDYYQPPLKFAIEIGNEEIIKLLREAGGVE